MIRIGDADMFHARLSIIDIEHGSQPLSAHDSFLNHHILFNGEIYNHNELRQQLSSVYTFSTKSDTEVLLAAYLIWGQDALQYLNGMYSFVIYNSLSGEIFFARDPSGQKPLFYSSAGENILISSCPFPVDGQRDVSPDSLVKYMYNGYISGTSSIYKNVKALLPGHSVTIKSGVWRENRYDNPIDYLSTPNTLALEDHDLLELLDQKIEQSVNYCTVADVPIGILLSAGIDSSLIYSYLKEIYNYSLSVFSFDSEDTHSEYAIAKNYCSDTLPLRCTKQIDADLFNKVYGTIFSQPFADSSALYTGPLYEYVSRTHKCVITGDGADEIFYGYGWRFSHLFSDFDSLVLRTRRSYSQLISNINSQLPLLPLLQLGYQYPIFNSQSIATFLGITVDQCTRNFNNYKPSGLIAEIDNVLVCDYMDYLPSNINVKSDELSMYYGVESRSPFQDPFLRQFVFSLPLQNKVSSTQTKTLLRQLHQQKYSNYSSRPKSGFGANYALILQYPDLLDLYSYFVSPYSKVSSLFDTKFINTILVDNYSAQRWNFMVLAAWLESNF